MRRRSPLPSPPAFEAGERFEGGVALAAAEEQQGLGERVAVVRRRLAPEHLEDLQRPVALAGAGEHAGEGEPGLAPVAGDGFHDPDPPRGVGILADDLDDDVVAALAGVVPFLRDASKHRRRFLGPVRAREHEGVHRRGEPVPGVEAAPLGACLDREAEVLDAGRHARGAPGEGRVAVLAGGFDVAPGRPGRVRLVTPKRRELRGEQVPEQSGRKSGCGVGLRGRRAGGECRGGGERKCAAAAAATAARTSARGRRVLIVIRQARLVRVFQV